MIGRSPPRARRARLARRQRRAPRFALVAGAPDGGPRTVAPLRRARCPPHARDPDARRRGSSTEDARLLLSAGAGDLVRALEALDRAGWHRAPAAAPALSRLLLRPREGRRPPARERPGAVRGRSASALEAAPADVPRRSTSCRSGAIARAKGVRPHPPSRCPRRRRGRAGSSSSRRPAGDEDSQESDAIGASWFTHHLASGLLGGADAGDGRVRSRRRTRTPMRAPSARPPRAAGSRPAPGLPLRPGPQRSRAHRSRAGRGRPRPPRRRGRGSTVVLDGAGRAVAEVAKGTGAERQVALPPAVTP